MHYNDMPARTKLLEKLPPDYFSGTKSKVLRFIDLCIYPYSWVDVYTGLKTRERISLGHYNALKGAITGLMVLSNKKYSASLYTVDEYVADFVDFIRNERNCDAERFMLNFRKYMPRYMLIKGLYVSFGIDWRYLTKEGYDLLTTPNGKSYHSICTCRPVRNLVWSYVVWRDHRTTFDDDYEANVNDKRTMTHAIPEKHPSLSYTWEQHADMIDLLTKALPSYNIGIRAKAAWCINIAQDGLSLIHKQMPVYQDGSTKQQFL